MLQLFPRMDLSLSTMCPKVSEKDQIVELDCKPEFYFSFPPCPLLQDKNGCLSMGWRSKLLGSKKKKKHLDNLEICVDVCTFTYYYSNLAVNMKINFHFLTLSILFKKMNALTNYTFPSALL